MTYGFLALLLEVMDKEPSVAQLWISGVLLGVLGFLAARWRRAAALPFCLFALVRIWAGRAELSDPFVGPAILREAGPSYPVHQYASSTLIACLALLGAGLPRRRPKGEL